METSLILELIDASEGKGEVSLHMLKNSLVPEMFYSESNPYTEAHILFIRIIGMVYINISNEQVHPAINNDEK